MKADTMRKRNLWTNAMLAAVLALSCLAWLGRPAAAHAAGEAAALALYVDPASGDDANDGAKASPFRTVAKARDAVRALNDNMTGDIVVYLRGGDYYFDETLRFDEQDSGTNGFDVVYRNYPGETPVLHAGQAVTGWEPYQGSIYRAHVGTDWSFDTLTENGEWAVKARYPNEGYSRVTGYDVANPRSAFYFGAGDIPVLDSIEGLEIFALPGGPAGDWSWASGINAFASIDYASGHATLVGQTPYEMGVGSRYYVMSALELLDAPGEFYLDKAAGDLYYWPREASIETRAVVAPKTKGLIALKGSSPEAKVRHIVFEGLTFTGTDRASGLTAYADAAIHMENAEHIAIRGSVIENVGGFGITAVNYANDIAVEGNRIRSVGNDAVEFISTNYETLAYKNFRNRIVNNHMYDMGILSAGAAGITLANSGENTVTHNLIHDGPRNAISLSGPNSTHLLGKAIEGVTYTLENRHLFKHTRDNLIAYNNVYAMNKNTQDTGLIYAWGAGTGNQIKYNYIHDSEIEFSFGHGIYMDDDVNGTLIEGNVIANLQNGGKAGELRSAIFARGIGTKIINNIIVNNNVSMATFASSPGGLPREAFEFRNNLVYDSGEAVFSLDTWTDNAVTASDANLFYHPTGQYNVKSIPGALDLEEWKQLYNNKFDQSSLQQDPLLRDAAGGDYRFAYASPAFGLGIREVLLGGIGPTPDFPYADPLDPLARAFVQPAGTEGPWAASLALSTGEQAALEVSGRTEAGFAADLRTASISYESLDPSVATVDATTGTVTAAGKGLTQIRVTVAAGGATAVADIDVAVDDALASLQLHAAQTGLLVGGQATATAKATSEFGRSQRMDEGVTFVSADPSVASVTADGRVTAVALGETTITAAASGLTAELGFGVYPAILQSATIVPENGALFAGGSTKLLLSGKLTNGQSVDLSQAAVTYWVDRPDVGTVSEDGVLQTYKEGRVKMTARVTYQGVTRLAVRSLYIKPSTDGPQQPNGWSLKNYGFGEGFASAQDGDYVFSASGGGIGGIVDDFSALMRTVPATGKVTIVATIEQFDAAHPTSSVGLMIRKNDSTYSKHAYFGVDAAGVASLKYRGTDSIPGTAIADGSTVALSFPAKLKLVFEDGIVTAYYGKGTEGYWTEAGRAAVEPRGDLRVGVALASGGAEQATAVVSDLEITVE